MTSSVHQEAAPQQTELLNAYYAAGFRLVPLKENKHPLGFEWQKREITRDEIERNLNDGGGVGVQAGACSGGVCAADLDCEEARKLAPEFLPDTLTSGKASEPHPSHYVYISEGLGYKKYQDAEGKELIALKASNNGAGHQFVVEPSVHPSKGAYRWVGGFNPSRITRISPEELEHRLGRLAAATLIAKYFPPLGGRHEYRKMVAGFLLRNGETLESAREIMYPALKIAGANHDGLRDVDAVLKDTAKRLDEDKPVVGGRKLNEAVPNLANRIGQALGWEQPNMKEGRRKYSRTDDGNALRFADRYSEIVRYCPAWKAWLLWDGKRWEKGVEGKVMRLARVVARSIHAEAADEADEKVQRAISTWAFFSQSAARLNAMLALAKTDERIEISPDAFDSDPWLLTLENGTLNLRSAELQPHDPADLITRLAPYPYDPHAQAPRFNQFLSEIFAGDEDLIAFVRRYAGYSLTGSTRERCLAILHGTGLNGKSTLVELFHDVMGDYAKGTDVETILAKKYTGVGNDVADLRGARFVSTSEVEKGRRLAESKVKQLTGSDTVTARFLFSEFFSFRPEFKLWASTNNRPEIRGTDNAIWDRVRLIPFEVRFEGKARDESLPEKLRAEAAGVLAWMVRGCLEWQADGLGTAAKVTEATQEYREDMDTLAAFISDHCVVGERMEVLSSALYRKYQMWCEDVGEHAESRKSFGDALKAKGFQNFVYNTKANRGKAGWQGIGLRTRPGDDPNAEDSMHDSSESSDDSNNQGPDHAEDQAGGEECRGSSESSSASESRVGKPNPENREEDAEDAEGESQNFASEQPRERKVSETPSASSASSASPPDGLVGDAPPELSDFLQSPPRWFVDQAKKLLQRPDGRGLNPLCCAVSAELYGSNERWEEVQPGVEGWLRKASA